MKIFFLFMSLVAVNCYSQVENIKLPKGYGLEVKYSPNYTTSIFNIYVDENGKTAFENIILPIDKLGDTIFKYRNLQSENIETINFTAIYADKNTPYKYIEQIKSQLSSAKDFNIIYKTDEFEDLSKGVTSRISRSLLPEKKILSLVNKESILFEEITIGVNTINQMIIDLYDLKFSKAKEILEKYKYKEIQIFNNEFIKIDGEKINLDDESEIYKGMKGCDFYFLSTKPTVPYKTYIKNVSLITKIYKKYENHLTLIEISSDLKKIMNKRKIKFK